MKRRKPLPAARAALHPQLWLGGFRCRRRAYKILPLPDRPIGWLGVPPTGTYAIPIRGRLNSQMAGCGASELLPHCLTNSIRVASVSRGSVRFAVRVVRGTRLDRRGRGTLANANSRRGSVSWSPDHCAAALLRCFGDVTFGHAADSGFYLNSDGGDTVTVDLSTGVLISGPGADDFVLVPPPWPDCNHSTNTITVESGGSCLMGVDFHPVALGDVSATMTVTASDGSRAYVNLSGTGTIGYYQVDEFGHVANYGDAAWYGDTGNERLNSPIVGVATPGQGGYWLVAADGGVYSFGAARFFGSAGSVHLNKPIVGMAALPDVDAGYWLVASDGGIFAYGYAPFYGSTGSMTLNKPIVGMATDPITGGYWLVASDGGVFAYNAPFYGSTGSIHLNKPIVGMVAAPAGNGYWLVASDGGIFALGPGAHFYGSAGSLSLAKPITSMAAMPDGSGYWFSAADGGLFSYGAPFYGGGTDDPNLEVVVGMASDS